MKMIYENDCPEIGLEQKHVQEDFEMLGFVKDFVQTDKIGIERWKPNGITDNRRTWKRRNEIYKTLQIFAKGGFSMKALNLTPYP